MFKKRENVAEIEEGNLLSPKFDNDGLIPVVTTCANTKEVLMHGYMNMEALKLTIETKEAHYWSRSRQKLWKKGEISGLKQAIVKILVDDDQDCMIFRVDVAGSGASCHVGYKSCFYRVLEDKENLKFIETEKLFDPDEVYEGENNPTIL